MLVLVMYIKYTQQSFAHFRTVLSNGMYIWPFVIIDSCSYWNTWSNEDNNEYSNKEQATYIRS